MRNMIIGLAASIGLLALAPMTASAAPVVPAVPQIAHSTAIQPADWYCGPRCQYWRHRRWEQARREHWRWEHRHHDWYGYNGYYHR